jgi:threonine synthase
VDAYLCPGCGEGGGGDPGILDVKYDYGKAGLTFDGDAGDPRGRRDMFRFASLLPIAPEASLLAAGNTPLLSAPRLARRVGLRALYIKDETRNPTRCLKDRATSVGVALALASGRRTLYCASAGNAAISLAAFCAQQGLECQVFVPERVSAVRLESLSRYGARITVADGNYDRAFELSERAGRAQGWYSRNCAFNPFLVEGKKTASFEIAEALGWEVPDIVVAPVGDGCTLGAIGKGFQELQTIGRTGRLPRLLGVQAEAVQPLVRRWQNQPSRDQPGETRATSISVRRPRNALRLLAQVQSSQGAMVAVTDDQVEAAQGSLSREAGVLAEFTSAATLAGLIRLLETEGRRDLTAVLVITGGRLD